MENPKADSANGYSANGYSARRRIYLLLILVIPLAGLGIRAYSKSFPSFFTSFAPDVLWAFLVFAVVVTVAPRLPTMRAASIALSYSVFMECSQLYQAPWINALRATTVGGLLLGYGFLWSDIVCYVVGVGLAVTLGVTFDRMLPRFLTWRSKQREERP